MNIGDRYGRLVIIGSSFLKPGSKWRNYYFPCRCDCGKEVNVRRSGLHSGDNVSCGCYIKEAAGLHAIKHGATRNGKTAPEYVVWGSMVHRCTNPKATAYPYYGGRGITVCDRWKKSFQAFFDDMGPRPEGTTLERVDNNKGYEKGNCKWVTHAEQMKNTRNCKKILFGVRELTVTDAAKEAGISKKKIYYFVGEHGVSHQEAFDHYASNEPKVAYRHHMTTRRSKRLREKADAK